MMAKPIKALELHYPTIQFLIIRNRSQAYKLYSNKISDCHHWKMHGQYCKWFGKNTLLSSFSSIAEILISALSGYIHKCYVHTIRQMLKYVKFYRHNKCCILKKLLKYSHKSWESKLWQDTIDHLSCQGDSKWIK